MQPIDIEGHRLVALLGPTNTGKTWRAIERMLEHSSGMMGLPLRLLAREVYDRVTERVGEDRTALITGEERRIGRAACYWICTTEAMPVDRPVDFLAVDEIQLAGDRNRGHVFTDRLLHARGTRETFFMGSDTIGPLFHRLFPHGEIRQYQRLSKLTYRGPLKIGSLPKRTALVAFSVERVYALAEEVRRKHGGTAVVLGALSPRTRNAQVAMYQAGEVQYMVATDAIGMGLNMDIDHVAFDRLHKFDGKQVRGLQPQEVAQIAGRAGRFRKDGSFGGTDEVGDMDPALIEAISQHRFPPLKKLFYRNPTLDFSSPAGLLASLRRPAPWGFLIEAREEEDEEALRALVLDAEIAAGLGAGGREEREEALRQLWEVCRIPDFRKTLTDSHHRLLKELLLELRKGPLRTAFVERQIVRMDRPEGDVDALTTRLAWIRTWTYITHRDGWLERPAEGRQLARAVEDRLSDALHAALTSRFVDPNARILQAAPHAIRAPDMHEDTLRISGVEAGRLGGLCFTPAPSLAQDRRLERFLQQEVQPEVRRRLEHLLNAPHEAIRRDGLTLQWRGGALAKLQSGPSALEPGLKLVRNDLLSPGDQAQLQRRLVAWLRDELSRRMEPLSEAPPALSRPLRGLIFRLREALGSLPRAGIADLIAEFTPADWTALRALKLRVGEISAWAPALLSEEGRSLRASLAALHLGLDPVPSLDAWNPKIPDVFYDRCGIIRVHDQLLRLEQAEQIAERIRALWKKGAATPEQIDALAGSTAIADAVLLRMRQSKGQDNPPGNKKPRR